MVILIGLFMLSKSVRFSWNDGVIAVAITTQKGPVPTLDTERHPMETVRMMMQRIDFKEARMLENSQYGALGYTTNFFIDAAVQMHVKRAGKYRFAVQSDDGFRLKIDGKSVCEHPGDRPFSTTECLVGLPAGTHRFDLSYFQGGGPMGLRASYGLAAEKKRYIVGEDTPLITFGKLQ